MARNLVSSADLPLRNYSLSRLLDCTFVGVSFICLGYSEVAPLLLQMVLLCVFLVCCCCHCCCECCLSQSSFCTLLHYWYSHVILFSLFVFCLSEPCYCCNFTESIVVCFMSYLYGNCSYSVTVFFAGSVAIANAGACTTYLSLFVRFLALLIDVWGFWILLVIMHVADVSQMKVVTHILKRSYGYR